MTDVEYLDIEDLLILATALLGDPPPVRDLGLLEAAASRPRASAFGSEAYPDIWTKAAALLQSIATSLPLTDGNQRLGWLACAVFLELNDVDVTAASNDEVSDLVMWVAAGTEDVDAIAERLRQLV